MVQKLLPVYFFTSFNAALRQINDLHRNNQLRWFRETATGHPTLPIHGTVTVADSLEPEVSY
jgi:hypothetical protein